ncbi:dolichol phosphate-mannose biosynthesis regulatory protein-domain-containing protein [Melampsora americana]|nr:dolichol phosphate-mannose biosynthesis regulatory protein-domain-containing protein [Melampsora americana]
MVSPNYSNVSFTLSFTHHHGLSSFLQGNSDRLLGGLMLFASACIFTYYTIWTLATPFFEPDSPIQNYFPDREWAVKIPAVALIFFMSAIAGLVSLVLIKQARKEQKKDLKRT